MAIMAKRVRYRPNIERGIPTRIEGQVLRIISGWGRDNTFRFYIGKNEYLIGVGGLAWSNKHRDPHGNTYGYISMRFWW